ncbi:MAG TPA: hypothetical protein VGG84_13245 [Gemmatimonadaceae bacterium]
MTDNSVSATLMPPAAHGRSAAEVIDAAVQLVREHYPTLVSVSAVALTPLLLLAPFAGVIPRIMVNIASIICAGYAEGCLIVGIAAVYTGEPIPSVGALLRVGNRVAGRVILITWTRAVVTTIGLIFLIVPGLFFYAYYLLGTPVAVLEDLKARPAIKRGAALAKGEYGRLIKIAILTGLIYLLLFFGAGVVTGLLTQSEAMISLSSTVIQILVLPAVVAVTVLLYYDIRERREGLDIELALGGSAAPATA